MWCQFQKHSGPPIGVRRSLNETIAAMKLDPCTLTWKLQFSQQQADGYLTCAGEARNSYRVARQFGSLGDLPHKLD